MAGEAEEHYVFAGMEGDLIYGVVVVSDALDWDQERGLVQGCAEGGWFRRCFAGARLRWRQLRPGSGWAGSACQYTSFYLSFDFSSVGESRRRRPTMA